jgi:hypothetical protein
MPYKKLTERHTTPCTVYLLHFSEPFHHARHYIGVTTNGRSVDDRLEEHRTGRGAKLTRAAAAAGVGMFIARVWWGVPRYTERLLKNKGGAAKLCPVCQGLKTAGAAYGGRRTGRRRDCGDIPVPGSARVYGEGRGPGEGDANLPNVHADGRVP